MKNFNLLLFFTAVTLCCLNFSACKSNEKQLQEYVDRLNESVYPRQLDEITWLDSLSVMPGLTVGSHYTLTDIEQFDFTPEHLEMMKFELKIQTLQSITSDDKDAKRFRNAGVTFYLEYKDTEGNLILDITVTPEEYKKAMKDK